MKPVIKPKLKDVVELDKLVELIEKADHEVSIIVVEDKNLHLSSGGPQILEVNPTLEKTLGFTLDEVMGKSLTTVFKTTDNNIDAINILKDALLHGKSYGAVQALKSKDGRPVTMVWQIITNLNHHFITLLKVVDRKEDVPNVMKKVEIIKDNIESTINGIKMELATQGPPPPESQGQGKTPNTPNPPQPHK